MLNMYHPLDYIIAGLNDEVMQKGRFWELDMTRGIAVVMMVLFHLAFDLNFFGISVMDIDSGFWFYFGRLTAVIFILLVGVSLSLYSARPENQGQGELRMKFFRRGAKIYSLGLGITIVTYFLIGKGFIVFGILHLIGLSIILAYPFLDFKDLNILFGVSTIAVGLYLPNLSFSFPWLLWLGLTPAGFYTLDYFPLFPWFGLILIGVYLGNTVYGGYERKIRLPDQSSNALMRPIMLLGRNSLLIYLIHQPLLVTALYLLGKANISIPLK